MDLHQVISRVTFVAFDFETTGLDPERDAIIEMGAVRFRDGEILDKFQSLINPGRPIPAESSKISGIVDSMLTGQPSITETLGGFRSFLGDSVLLAHNIGFDRGFLNAELLRQKQPFLSNQYIDTQALAKKAFPGQKSYSLQNLITFLNIPPNQAHRALDDALMCMRLFQACCDRMSFMGELMLEEVLIS